MSIKQRWDLQGPGGASTLECFKVGDGDPTYLVHYNIVTIQAWQSH